MSRSDDHKKRKKQKTEKGDGRKHKSKRKQNKVSKKRRHRSASHEKDDRQEHVRDRETLDSSLKRRNGDSSSVMDRDRYNSNRKYEGKESSRTKHASSPSSSSSTGERSKSPEAERVGSPAPSAGRGGGSDQNDRKISESRTTSNGRHSRREKGNSPSREGPRNHKRVRSPSATRSPTRSMKDYRRSSRGRTHHSKDTIGRSRITAEERVGLRGPRRDSWSRHWRSRDSTNRLNGRSPSRERKRWSPSPSPTAPTRRQRSNSRHREPGNPADRRSRRASNGDSPPKSEGLGHRRGSHRSPHRPNTEQQLKGAKDLSHDEATVQLATNSSNGKESQHGDRSDGAGVTRRPSKDFPNVSNETHRKTQKSSGKKKASDKKALLSFGDDIGEQEGGSSEFKGLRAATLNEFKRNQRSQTLETLTPALSNTTEQSPISAGRFDEMKQKGSLLGPPKISTAECRGQREYQEDRHVVVLCFHSPIDAHTKFEANPPSFFAVYDGHNGDFASELAKSKLHTFIAKAAPSTGLLGEPPERLEGLLRAAFASAEAEILEKAEEDGSRQDGTTATACLLAGDLLVTANVGDSRAVLGSVGRGDKLHCRDISTDHKPEIASEKRRIEAAGGEVVFNGCHRIQHGDVACRLAVSRSLGDMQFKVERSTEEGDGGADGNAPLKRKEQLVSPEPEMKSIRLAPRDRVVIVASDGLWDVMTGLEAVEIALASHERALGGAKRAPSWANALTSRVAGDTTDIDPATALMKEAVKRETADNVTVVVVILPWN